MPQGAEPPAIGYSVERLAWTDPPLGTIALPAAAMDLRTGFGSGLTTRPGDPPGHVWAVGDRGPNLKVKVAVRRYGVEALAPLAGIPGAKIMPRPGIGPTIAELRITDHAVELIRTIRLVGQDGMPVSGLPPLTDDRRLSEPVFSLDGEPLAPDPDGLDTEGIVALRDGGFWIGDEFGPSLVRIDQQGTIIRRLLPGEGQGHLPPIAARRQRNRGFEALALSHDEQWLFLAFQSPLAHPDQAAHEHARHVRIWRLDAERGDVCAQYLYPLDSPERFVRDRQHGAFERSDIKVSELVCLGDDTLLVLERGSETTKLYRVKLSEELALAPEHLAIATRPTVEDLSGSDAAFILPTLTKTLIFTSDEVPELTADIEGMAILSATELLLVNDNDFGVEGAETCFWKIRFDAPILA